jgi:hypothetical protein
VQLAPPAEGAGCELHYSAQAQVGGKIAQVGQRLVDGVAKSMADDFFKRFDEEMRRRYPQAYAEAAAAPPPVAPLVPLWAWVVATVIALAALWLLLR